MNILTKEQVEEMSVKDATQALKQLESLDILDKGFDTNPELWDQCDDIANTLLYLEDHIRHLDQLASLAKANAARWAKD